MNAEVLFFTVYALCFPAMRVSALTAGGPLSSGRQNPGSSRSAKQQRPHDKNIQGLFTKLKEQLSRKGKEGPIVLDSPGPRVRGAHDDG